MVVQDHVKLMLLNLMKYQWPDIDKMFLYMKDPFELKYQLLMKGTEKVGIKEQKKVRSTCWLFTNKWWCLWKFRRLQSNKENVWWYGCRYGS